MTTPLKITSLVIALFELCAVATLAGPSSASDGRQIGIWSEKGRIPQVVDGATADVVAPDGGYAVRGTANGLQLVDVNGKVDALPILATAPLWEVIWAPNSKSFAINASDGGTVGTWDSVVYRLDHAPPFASLDVSSLARAASADLPQCREREDLNVAVVGWAADGAEVLVVAEVPPHSSCMNMGDVVGFRISVRLGKILEQLPEQALRQQWGPVLGCRFQQACRLN